MILLLVSCAALTASERPRQYLPTHKQPIPGIERNVARANSSSTLESVGKDEPADDGDNSAGLSSDWSFWTMVATGVYALFAGLQWLAIRHQATMIDRNLGITDRAVDAANRNATAAFESAKAATRSADIARDTLYVTQGADIQLEDTEWEPADQSPLDVLPNATVTVRFKNYGHTAARNVIFDLRLGITSGRVSTHFAPNPPVTLGAGHSMKYGFKPMRFIFEDVNDLIKVAKGESEMRLWGTVTYDDAFNRHIEMRLGYTWIVGTTTFSIDDFETKITNDSRSQSEG